MKKTEIKPNNQIGARIDEIIYHFRINLSNFAKKLSLSHGYISEIRSGAKPLNKRTAQLISLTFKVNESWLLTGEGEMLQYVPDQHPCEKKIPLSVCEQLSAIHAERRDIWYTIRGMIDEQFELMCKERNGIKSLPNTNKQGV